MNLASRNRGFTLVELMVVILIIGLLAVATLPVIVPSLQQSSINAAARELQAEIAAARDAAVRTNTPHGIRFLPDDFDPTVGQPYLKRVNPSDPNSPQYAPRLTSHRYIAIEQGPNYSEGLVRRYFDSSNAPPPYPDANGNNPYYYPPPPVFVGAGLLPPSGDPYPPVSAVYPYLVLHEDKYTALGSSYVPAVPNSPTAWYFNLRQGDRIRLNDSGRIYTIAGPIGIPNDSGSFTRDRFINYGASYQSNPSHGLYEFLFLVNGEDDDGDGYVDEGFDGIDNDGDGIIDPGFNGVDDDGDNLVDDWQEQFLHRNADGSFIYPGCLGSKGTAWPPGVPTANEFEQEKFTGNLSADTRYSGPPSRPSPGVPYTVLRRPVPSPGAREINLASGVLLDLTTWDADKIPVRNGIDQPYVPERSRLPVDPATGYVDVLIAPGGQVIQQSFNANPAPSQNLPFYHFWLADLDDTHDSFPLRQYAMLLPMIKGSDDDPSILVPPNQSAGPYQGTGQAPLQANRRLVSLNTQTGQVVTTSVETMYTNNPSYPFKAAEAGQKEEP